MPTFARLVAAILFAALAAGVSHLTVPLFPDEAQLKYYYEFNTFLGLIVGWRVAGSRAGLGYSGAIGVGLTAAVAGFLVILFFQSAVEMVRLSMRKQYDSAPEAVVGIFEIMYEWGVRFSTLEIWGATLLGGVVAALIMESVSRRVD